MKKRKIAIIFFSFLTFWGIGIFLENGSKKINDVQATGEEICVPTARTEDVHIRDEFRCRNNNCGTDVLRREKRRRRTCWTNCPSVPPCGDWTIYYTEPTIFFTMGEWAKCEPGQTAWFPGPIRWGCQGVCLRAPQNGQPNRGNVHLPADFTWDNVPGFGNVPGRGPMSYRKTIDNTNIDAAYTSDFHHDFLGGGELPLFHSLPDLDLLKGSPIDGRFVQVNGQYRFTRPVPHRQQTITSCFGYRIHPILREIKMHHGIDIGHGGGGPSPIPIYAAAPGVITAVLPGNNGGAGNAVIIDHSDYSFDLLSDDAKIETVYFHLSAFSASAQYGRIIAGDRITPDRQIRGIRKVYHDHDDNPDTEKEPQSKNVTIRNNNIIGFMGTTGRSTGIHLHFEIRMNGKRVNPLSLITIPSENPWQLSGRNCPQPPGATASLRHFLATYTVEENDDQSEFHSIMSPFSYKDKTKDETNLSTTILLGNRFSAENCLLRPLDTYNWSVQACCNFDGTNCGPISRWTMSTSDRPEVLRQGTESGRSEAESEIIYKLEDADLRWCEMRIERGGHKSRPDRYEIIVEQRLPRFELWGFRFFETFRCHPLLHQDGKCQPIIRSALLPGQSPPTYLENEVSLLFTKSDYAHYRWQVRACEGEECGDYSSWRFIKISEEVTVSPPTLIFPSDDPAGQQPISWPIEFHWSVPVGANSYQFQLYEGTQIILDTIVENIHGVEGQITRVAGITLPRKETDLKVDTAYRWRVRSCWDTEGNPDFCEEEWSERHFITTGRPPLLNYPLDKATETLIPLTLGWEEIPGARSYLLTLNEEKFIVKTNKVIFDYPTITQNTLYHWSVQSCNDEAGKICGNESIVHSFGTILLHPPQNLKPPTADYFRDRDRKITLSWDLVPGANYYHLSVLCGENNVLDTIIQSNKIDFSLTCFGPHLWSVRACLDKNCQETGGASQGSFILHPGAVRGVGFVPCGLDYNNPNTPWDETKVCQLNHLFIMFKIILDFLFWQLMPLILVVMAIISGVLFYISLGNVNVLTRVKSIWKSVGKGIAIMFLAWLFISIIMTIMGYTGIYGPWWQISL